MSKVLLRELQPGTAYAIQVRTNTGDGVSNWSRLYAVTTNSDALPPDSPSWAVTNDWVVSADTFVANWQAITPGLTQNRDFNHYEVELSDGTTTRIVSTTNLSYTLDFQNNRIFFGTPKATVLARVRAVDNAGNASIWSSQKSATNAAPSAPTNFVATPAIDMIQFSWDAITDTDLDYYAVYVGTPGPSTMIFKGLSNKFTHRTTTYSDQTYTLRAYDKFGTPSTPDRTATAQPTSPFGGGDTTPPNAPTAFSATVVDDPQGMLLTQTAKATWTAPTPTDITLAGYHIRYKKSGTTDWNYTEAPKDPQQPFIIDRYLQPNVNYDFEIRSFDAAGLHSAWVADTENAVTPAVVPTLTNALIIAAGGFIRSGDYTGGAGSTLGWKIDDDGVDFRSGVIRGNTISTGQIVSTADATKWDYATNAYVPDTARKAFVIDLEGDAELNNVLVRGNIVVGALDTTAQPPVDSSGNQVLTGYKQTIASGNYIPGLQGWSIRDDGYAEFQNVVANSLSGKAIKAETLSLNTLVSNDTLTQAINVKGSLIVRNDTVGSLGEGSSITLDSTGFYVRGSNALGNPDYITFPTTGAPNIISGSLQASTLTVSGLINPDTGERQAATFRGISHVELGSEFILDNAVSAPAGVPTFTNYVPYNNFPGAGGAGGQDLLEYYNGFLWRVENWASGNNVLVKYDLVTGFVQNYTIPAPLTVVNSWDDQRDTITGITRLGSYWYFLFTNTSSGKYCIAQYSDSTGSLVKVDVEVFTITTGGLYTLGNDGTNLLEGRWKAPSSTPSIVHRGATYPYTAGTTVTFAAGSFPPAFSISDKLLGVTAGDFDYGTGNKTYILGFAQNVNGTYINQVRAVNASGVRQQAREWPLASQSSLNNGFAVNRANNRFYDTNGTNIYEYSGTMWTGSESSLWGSAYSWYNASGRAGVTFTPVSGSATFTAPTGTFYVTDIGADFTVASGTALPSTVRKITNVVVGAGTDTITLNGAATASTAMNITIAYETPVSPIASLNAKKRWWVKATGAFGPTGTTLRMYAGRNAVAGTTPIVSDLHLQSTLSAGLNTYSDDVVDFTTVAPKTSSTYAVGTPGKVYAQQTDTVVATPVTVVAGNTTITSTLPVFYANYVGAVVSAAGSTFQSNTKIVTVNSPTSVTVDKAPGAAMSGGPINIVRPMIELRGDGYARISQLYAQQTILTSTQDVNILSGNMPPLRLGNIYGGHMRMDGDEFQAMSDDTTPSIIRINAGGGSIKLGANSGTFRSVDMGFRNLSANASGVDTVPHQLGVTPDFVLVSPFTTAAFRHVQVQTKTATGFTVVVQDAAGAAVPNSTLQIGWMAFYL